MRTASPRTVPGCARAGIALGALAAAMGAVPAVCEAVNAEPGSLPAFSRLYRTSCSTCHVAPGKLNAQGEAFRLNGYRFPLDDERLRQDEPVPLGAEPWKDLWPAAVWPGEIPGALPLSLYVANDVRIGRNASGETGVSYVFPTVVGIHAATALGGGIGVLVGAALRPGSGLQLVEGKVKLQHPLPWLPRRSLNLWLGMQRPHLLMLADPSLDRVARAPPLWQRVNVGEWTVEDPRTGGMLTPQTALRLGAARPALELNGLLTGRFYYGIGLAQPAARAAEAARATDTYLKLRYKIGGEGLDGRTRRGAEPVAWGGQLLERSLTIESFVQTGEAALELGGVDRHRTWGVAARTVAGRVDAGIGRVWGRHSAPWGTAAPGARHDSGFARAELMAFPWLIGSTRIERTRFRVGTAGTSEEAWPVFDRTRLLPGVIVLVHHNVRAIAEAEFYLRQRPHAGQERERHALWLRFDLGF
jgi:hypothetical protein